MQYTYATIIIGDDKGIMGSHLDSPHCSRGPDDDNNIDVETNSRYLRFCNFKIIIRVVNTPKFFNLNSPRGISVRPLVVNFSFVNAIRCKLYPKY